MNWNSSPEVDTAAFASVSVCPSTCTLQPDFSGGASPTTISPLIATIALVTPALRIAAKRLVARVAFRDSARIELHARNRTTHAPLRGPSAFEIPNGSALQLFPLSMAVAFSRRATRQRRVMGPTVMSNAPLVLTASLLCIIQDGKQIGTERVSASHARDSSLSGS